MEEITDEQFKKANEEIEQMNQASSDQDDQSELKDVVLVNANERLF